MNAKLANQIEEMKKQIIGVEIEMANITRRAAIEIIAKYFGTQETVNHVGGTYDTWSCMDNKGRTWNINSDSNIHFIYQNKKQTT